MISLQEQMALLGRHILTLLLRFQGYVHAARAALCSPRVALLHDSAIVGDDVLWAFKKYRDKF